MLLIVTNKLDTHVDLAIPELNRRGIKFFRVNTEDFPQEIGGCIQLQRGKFVSSLTLPVGEVKLSTIRSVWYRKVGPPVIDSRLTEEQYVGFALRESLYFLRGLWSSTNCLWVNHPSANRRADEKIVQLKVAMELGFCVPDTLITNIPQRAVEFIRSVEQRVVIKPLHQEIITERGVQKIVFTHLLSQDNLQSIEAVRYAPCILQAYIEKEVELRVTVFGNQVFTAAIDSQASEMGKTDWRRALTQDLRYDAYQLPILIEERCISLLQALGLQFGAIDMILTPSGEYVFLEINPNGQWFWIEAETGLPMMDALINLLTQDWV